MDLSHQSLKKIEEIYQNISTDQNSNLDEQQSDVSRQWERGARWIGKNTDKYIANPVSSAVRSAADYAGQATSGVVKAMTGGSVDLEDIGRKAEKIIGSGGEKPKSKPNPTPTSKPAPTATSQKPAQPRDSGREAGEYLAPSRGSSKAADPVVRAGGSYGFFGAIKPSTAKPSPTTPAKPQSTVKKDPRGAVIVNHLEVDKESLVTEAPAQVAPISGTGGKGWYQKNKSGEYVPITDPELAKKAAERWKAQTQKSKNSRLDAPIAGPGPKGNEVGSKPPAAKPPAAKPPAAKPSATRTAPKPSDSPEVSKYMSAAAAARKSGSSAEMSKVRDTGLDIWRKKYASSLAKNVTPSGTQKGTGQSDMAKQAAELRALRPAPQAPGSEKPGYSGPPTPTAPQAQSKLAGGSYSSGATKLMSQRTKNVLGVKESYDAFDLVLEYLLSQGHVGTLDEALYVMMEMDSEMIQNIVEGDPSYQLKRFTGAGSLTPSAAAQLGPKAVELQRKKASEVDLPNLKQSPGSMAKGA
jgi:hypothetical protein